uniref:Uncharacterized protein n=1 Tax=Oryza glumipatula TaxID=40148 RepID=A0A0D9ZAT3_9ORYZ
MKRERLVAPKARERVSEREADQQAPAKRVRLPAPKPREGVRSMAERDDAVRTAEHQVMRATADAHEEHGGGAAIDASCDHHHLSIHGEE